MSDQSQDLDIPDFQEISPLAAGQCFCTGISVPCNVSILDLGQFVSFLFCRIKI